MLVFFHLSSSIGVRELKVEMSKLKSGRQRVHVYTPHLRPVEMQRERPKREIVCQAALKMRGDLPPPYPVKNSSTLRSRQYIGDTQFCPSELPILLSYP